MAVSLAYIDLLPPDDLFTISNLRARISQKYQRDRRVKHFQECLTFLISFVDQQSEHDWKRALVCGICQVDTALAVNNARLQAFTGFSKSSINDIFARMEYRAVPLNRTNQVGLFAKIPLLMTNHDELRQWTYRVRDRALLNSFIPGNTCVSSPPAIPSACGVELDRKPSVLEPAQCDTRVDNGPLDSAEWFADPWDCWGAF
jgi:hypothetical protein